MIPGVGRPHGMVLVLCMLLAACTTDNEPQITIIERESALIGAALARLEATGTSDVEYSIWLGPATGPAWYRYNAAAVRPAASAIKTACGRLSPFRPGAAASGQERLTGIDGTAIGRSHAAQEARKQ